MLKQRTQLWRDETVNVLDILNSIRRRIRERCGIEQATDDEYGVRELLTIFRICQFVYGSGTGETTLKAAFTAWRVHLFVNGSIDLPDFALRAHEIGFDKLTEAHREEYLRSLEVLAPPLSFDEFQHDEKARLRLGRIISKGAKGVRCSVL